MAAFVIVASAFIQNTEKLNLSERIDNMSKVYSIKSGSIQPKMYTSESNKLNLLKYLI